MKSKLALVFVSTVISIIFLWLFLHWLSLDIYQKQSTIGKQQIKVTSDVVTDVNQILDQLNFFKKIDMCSEDMLVEMRRAMFNSKYIKDVGYVDNARYLQCTTGLGKLKKPILENEPDYVSQTGAKVWINKALIFFDMHYKAFIIQKGNFNAVIDPKDLNTLFSSNFIWTIVFKHDDKYLHLLGSGQNFNVSSGKSRNKLGYFHYQECADNGYCVALTLTKAEFLSRYSLAIVTSVLTTVLLFATSYLSLSSYSRRRSSIEYRVKKGLKKQAFYPLFQPIVDLSTGKVIGCEVLARYQDELGEIFPDTFIPIVRDLNLTWEFTENLVSKALQQLETELDEHNKFKVSFNIFPCDITSGTVMKISNISEITSSKYTIVLEIIENEKLAVEEVSSYLNSLANLGFEIAIDDFGTGYSNLQQIASLPCDYLKIDRSFINEMEGGSIRSTLIPHIVEIAAQLNVVVVAEGVENAMQQNALVEAGVNIGQGWAFGKPMPADALIRLVSLEST